MKKPPTMTRSRNQLAIAYAPGSLFTFEGGIGACRAIPEPFPKYYEAHVTETTRRQILQRVDEIAASWFQRAFNCRNDVTDPVHSILGELCVDEELLNPTTRTQTQRLSQGRVYFVDPTKMSYEPAPLSFQCRHCKLFRSYSKVNEAATAVTSLKPDSCPHPRRFRQCDWQQLDVVHVHWSGECVSPQPGRYDWHEESQDVKLMGTRCTCGRDDFELDDASPSIGKWRFKCAHCGTPLGDGRWIQRDPFTIGELRERYPMRSRDAAMEATSYRASAAYYAHSDMFILFDQENEGRLRILEPERQVELETFIAQKYGFHGPALSDDALQSRLTAAGKEALWKRYQRLRKQLDLAREFGDSSDDIDGIKQDIAEQYHSFFHGPTRVLDAPRSLPQAVAALLQLRESGNNRFDPFRLALEHDVLRESTINRPRDEYGRRRFVPFADLDQDLCPNGNEREIKRIHEATQRAQERLHFSQFGLIREFELCRFSFGYTRVSPLPVIERHDINMPVRLKLFEKIDHPTGGKCHPIYVITQSNEAMYVQLNEQAVYEWLERNDALDGIEWAPVDEVRLGGHLLQRAQLFGRFVDTVKPGPPSPYIYAYTLLHTLSHAMMKTIASNSGLDVGSLGEYIFPTDLAFVVYRSGTTMDLGNLSALWRNQSDRFLSTMLEARTWACNSGSLCAEKGGACPDCILIPETSCIAQNQLLSRSVVRGGLSPREDERRKPIYGFLGQ